MTKINYKTIACEGGDQTGKADAILTFAKKLQEKGISVTYTSFPVYATPIGTTIRLFLRQGLDDLKLSRMRELKAKMAVYALNRLEFMDVFLSNPKFKDTIILLDRSPFSNAITIAYGLANVPDMHNYGVLNDLVNYALELESFMIKKLNLNNCVIQMVSEERSWSNVRHETADINENEAVQLAGEKIYDMYEDRIGEGWKKIVTRTKEGWRDRDDIFDDIYTFFTSRVGSLDENMSKGMLKMRYEIGIEEILKHLYKGETLPEGIISNYLKALRENDKDAMHNYGCKIGLDVGNSCRTITFKNKGVKNAANKIIDDVPEALDVLAHFVSKEFVNKLRKGLDDK